MKDTKKQAQYTPVAMKPSERCAVCRYYIRFNKTVGACQKVMGGVEAQGWCRHWEKK